MLSTLKAERMAEGSSAGTINREMSLLQSLLGFGESIGAPMPSVPIKWSARNNRAASLKMPETKGRLRWLTVEEERQFFGGLIEDASNRPNDLAAMDAWHLTQFLLDTGARHTEISSLTWDMVDLKAGTINLYRGQGGQRVNPAPAGPHADHAARALGPHGGPWIHRDLPEAARPHMGRRRHTARPCHRSDSAAP